MSVTINGSDSNVSAPAIAGTTSTAGVYFPSANVVAISTSSTEAMRVDSSGNVGIGTTSSISGKFSVNGSVYAGPGSASGVAYGFYPSSTYGNTGMFSPAANTVAFATSGGECARITSGGDFLIGTATGAGRLRVERSDNTDVAYVVNTNASFTQDLLRIEASRGATNAYNLIRARANGVDQFFVSGNGVIYAQNTTVQSASDARMKENIRDAQDGLNVISALRPVRYDFKAGFGNDRKDQLGFIAQEVEPIFPDAVGEFVQDGETYKSVGPGALIPVLVKAVQELKAELDALKAKVK